MRRRPTFFSSSPFVVRLLGSHFPRDAGTHFPRTRGLTRGGRSATLHPLKMHDIRRREHLSPLSHPVDLLSVRSRGSNEKIRNAKSASLAFPRLGFREILLSERREVNDLPPARPFERDLVSFVGKRGCTVRSKEKRNRNSLRC